MRGSLAELLARYEQNEPRGEYVIVIEGKPPEKRSFTVEEAAALAKKLIEEGAKTSDACKEAAKITGVSKREIYAAVLGEN